MNTEDIVRSINGKLLYNNIAEHDYFSYLEYIESPIGDYIKYMGHYIWDSDNDPREWVDDNTQECLVEFLVKEMTKIMKIVQSQVKTLED